MKNRSVWLTTGLIFLIILVFVFVLLDGMGPDFESEMLDNEPQTSEIDSDTDEEEEDITEDEEIEDDVLVDEEMTEETEEDEDILEEGASEYTIQAGDTLAEIADEFGVSTEDLQYWNGLFEPSALNEGATLVVDGPNAEQAQKEEWQWVFEQELYDNEGVTVSEYEEIEDGYYGVYINEVETSAPYVTVNSDTGEYSS